MKIVILHNQDDLLESETRGRGPQRHRRIAILGFGREGKAVLEFLQKLPDYKKADITILDRDPKIKSRIKNKELRVRTGKDYLKNLEEFDIVFRSPGVPYSLPEIQKVIKKGVELSSATKLFFDLAAKRPDLKFLGVTGTKGKGTTSTLIYKILKSCGKNVVLAGNIGKPVIEVLSKLKKGTIVIIELSSFQLQDLNLPAGGPNIAVVLDIFPDHMDSHKNMKEYLDAKASITKYQNPNDKVFYFSDNKYSTWIAQKSKSKKIPVSAKNFELFKESEIKMPGSHNYKNAVMAATIALSLGCLKEKILKTIKKFKGNEHRLELTRTMGRIKFYNDSASTNPQTAAAAVLAFSEPTTRAQNKFYARSSTEAYKGYVLGALILIAGGRDKNLNYAPLGQALKKSNTKLVALYGENKKKIYKSLVNSNKKLEIKITKDLESAINMAYKKAKVLITNYHLPITIVFSPASTSFDMFRNYEERGKKFKELVRKLTPYDNGDIGNNQF